MVGNHDFFLRFLSFELIRIMRHFFQKAVPHARLLIFDQLSSAQSRTGKFHAEYTPGLNNDCCVHFDKFGCYTHNIFSHAISVQNQMINHG